MGNMEDTYFFDVSFKSIPETLEEILEGFYTQFNGNWIPDWVQVNDGIQTWRVRDGILSPKFPSYRMDQFRIRDFVVVPDKVLWDGHGRGIPFPEGTPLIDPDDGGYSRNIEPGKDYGERYPDLRNIDKHHRG